ncbi:hypothetical protein WJX75_004797 [Coccomyxa subellipsoidea]|uniref:Galactose oxidase n=1 Tax=Coccomyxa subellipsoidea TaxID=248742 RepID=A0ABR2YHQ0_9CHLO
MQANILPTIGHKACGIVVFFYLNIAQAYLQLSKTSSDIIDPVLAGHAVMTVCTKASRIITMMMAAPDAMQGLGNDFGANISAQMHKACNRKGLGAELAGNLAAANIFLGQALKHMPQKQPLKRSQEQWAKAENARKALEPFVSRSESVALPKQILQYKPSLQYQYTATMQIVASPEMPREGKYEGMFHCGHWMGSQFLVMRLKHQGLFTYAIFVQRGCVVIFIDSFSKVPARLIRGVRLKRKLYLMSDDGTMLVTRLEDDLNLPFDKGAVMINTITRYRPDYNRSGCTLEAHGEHLYIFGGCCLAKNGEDVVPSNDFFRLKEITDSIPTKASTMPYEMLQSGHCPAARFGHVSWQQKGKMYVFGGINEKFEPINDLWVFHFKTLTWRQLDPLGAPSPRALMGVASLGRRAVIVGGEQGLTKGVSLCDIYEFDPDQCCFIQVLPGPEQRTWMSGRSSPCCALVDDSHLIVIGEAQSVQPLRATNFFDIYRGRNVALSLRTGCCRELKRDPWLEGICAARMHLSLSGIAQASEPLRRIVTAPPMALTFFTRHILHLTLALPYPGSLFPGIDGGPDFKNGLEWSLSRHPWLTDYGEEDPLRINRIPDGHGRFLTPFHVAPAHLGYPNEVTVHLAAPVPAQRPAGSHLTHLSLTIKVFGTVKGAVQYFGAGQPSSSEPSWRQMEEPLRQILVLWEQRLLRNCDTVYELDGYTYSKRHGPRKGVQVYFTAVVGRAFFALQTTYAPDNEQGEGFQGVQRLPCRPVLL